MGDAYISHKSRRLSVLLGTWHIPVWLFGTSGIFFSIWLAKSADAAPADSEGGSYFKKTGRGGSKGTLWALKQNIVGSNPCRSLAVILYLT